MMLVSDRINTFLEEHLGLNRTYISARPSFKKSSVKEINGIPLCFGMEWYEYNLISKTNILHSSIESNSYYVTLIKSEEGGGLVGVPAGINHLPKNCRSAAQVVCDVYENSIVVIKFSYTKYWLLATIDGKPVLEKDVVSEFPMIKKMCEELLILYPDFKCTGDNDFWRENFSEIIHVEESEDTLFDVDRVTKNPALILSRGKLKGIIKKVLPLFMLLLVGILTYSYTQNFFKKTIENFDTEALKDKWDVQILGINNDVLEKYNTVASNHPLSHWIVKLASTVDKLPIQAGGWNLSLLTCASGLPYCTVEWKARPIGTFKSLYNKVNYLGKLDFSNKDTAYQTIPIINYKKTRFDIEAIEIILEEMPNLYDFKLEHFSTLQKIGSIGFINFGVKMNNREKAGYTIAPPTELGESAVLPLSGFEYGEWGMKGKGITILLGAMQMLEPTIFFGQSLEIKYIIDTGRATTTWEIEGKYVIKSI
jgi:hypothetical protein